MPQSKWFVNGVGVAGAWVPVLSLGVLLSGSGCIGVSQPKVDASAPSKEALSGRYGAASSRESGNDELSPKSEKRTLVAFSRRRGRRGRLYAPP